MEEAVEIIKGTIVEEETEEDAMEEILVIRQIIRPETKLKLDLQHKH